MSEYFQAFTDINTSTETFHSLSKFLVSTAAALSPAVTLSKLSRSFAEVDTLCDGVRFISDVKHAIQLEFVQEFIEKKYAKLCSSISFFVADFGSAVALLGFFGFIDLQKVSSALGALSAFGYKVVPQCVVKIVTGAISLQIQTLAFFFLGVQTAFDIAKQGPNKRNLVTAATCIGEIFHKAFLFTCAPHLSPVLFMGSAGALGMVANGFGIWHAYDDVFVARNKKSA